MQFKGFLSKVTKSILVAGAMSVSAFAGADAYSQQQCAPEPCCDWNAPCHEAPCLGQAYNPSAYFDCGPNTCFLDNVALRVDFLYWRASSCDTDLGYQETWNSGATFSNGYSSTESLARVTPKPHFDPGFRVGLGYVCPCDGWDAEIIYTSFHTQATAEGYTVAGDEDNYTVFRPLWDAVADSVPDYAKGKFKLDVDYLDLELGHKYYVSRCFALRPYIGLRGARINQSYSYEGFANRDINNGDFDRSSDEFNSAVSAKNNFLGAGPRVGLDIDFDLGCNFVLFGEAAGSILYGRFENHSNEYYNDFSDGSIEDAPYKFNQHSPSERSSGAITDLVIGLRWEHCLCLCGTQHPVSLSVSWEHHGFYGFSGFNRNRGVVDYDTDGATSPTVSPTSRGQDVHSDCRGDFYTQGLTLSGTFGF